jgi:heat shock protein HtpX
MLRSKIRMEGSILTVGPARRSLAAWAALAAIVVVFSFVFTLFLAVASVYLPYPLLTRTTAFNIQVLVLFLGGIVIAATIIWSLIPRRDRFTPPGPLLSRDEQPRLFAEIEQIAGAFREPMPSAVYLTPEVNAWVGQRGGVTGVGSHRVMGLGLPLMQVLINGGAIIDHRTPCERRFVAVPK